MKVDRLRTLRKELRILKKKIEEAEVELMGAEWQYESLDDEIKAKKEEIVKLKKK